MANLAAAIRLADRVYVDDNSVDGIEATLCARMSEGRLRKVYGPLPDWVSDVAVLLERHPELVDMRAA